MKRAVTSPFVFLIIIMVSIQCRHQISTISGSIKISGIDYPYLIEGTGTPCLVYGINSYYTKAFSANFRRSLKCYFVDSRFVIPSAPVDTVHPFTIDEAVNEIESIRKALKLDKMVLVGHSILGLVVLEYGHRYPEHVSHILAIGTLPEISKNQTKITAEYWNEFASPERKERAVNIQKTLNRDSLATLSPSEKFIAGVVAVAPKRWYNASYDENLLLSGIQYNVPILNQLMGQEFYLFKDSTKIQPPVFLALGKFDFACPPVAWEKYLHLFKDVKYQVFEFSGHDPMVEEPEKFDSLVLKWIGERR
jgi:proline iminopeptidase